VNRGAGGEVLLPSGRRVRLFEVVRGLAGAPESWAFRFVDAALGPEIDFEALEPDLALLCREIALPALGPGVGRVVISLADRETPFGAPAPEAVQLFEAYRVAGEGSCEWEPF